MAMGLPIAAGFGAACAHLLPWRPSTTAFNAKERLAVLQRAQVWAPTNIGALDLKTGPKGPGAFAHGQTVRCDYVERDMSGRSPKFTCVIPGNPPDELKVKYGEDNAEVYGEVLSTRLLWALGFGADRMYPVRVICRGCPETIKAERVLPSGEKVFDPAVIERKTPGWEVESHKNQGWAWSELDLVDPEQGGAPQAHRDALKLVAVIIHHSDSKPPQQRLICLDPEGPPGPEGPARCAKPFMYVQDVGLTFGKTDVFYRKQNYVNLSRWSSTRVWAGREGCTGNLNRPVLGTLERPRISEAGRVFLAGLLNQLRDDQIQDLFEGARITLRSESPDRENGDAGRVEDWVAAFKRKRQEVMARTCEF